MGNALGRRSRDALLATASTTAIAAELQRSPHFVHAPLTWNDRTMWHLAADQGHQLLLQALQHAVLECFDERQHSQQHGAGTKLRRQLARHGDTPHGVLRSLVNAADVKGTTPLMAAAGSGHCDCVRHLLALGADPRHQVGIGTALSWSPLAGTAARNEGRGDDCALATQSGRPLRQ